MIDVEGIVAELRLKEITEKVAQLRQFVDVEPNNQLLINLLEEERRTIMRNFMRVVRTENSTD